MMVAVGLEIAILEEAFDWHIGPSWYVMWGLLATGFVNFFLFIASASYCCSIGNSCGCCSSDNAEVLVVTNGQQPVGTSNVAYVTAQRQQNPTPNTYPSSSSEVQPPQYDELENKARC